MSDLRTDVSCETFKKQLQKSLLSFPVSVNDDVLQKCFDFWELLLQWNSAHNLTSISDTFSAIDLHFSDSFSPLLFKDLFFNGAKVLDFGTGGGFPGIPLSFYFKNCDFTLLDKSRKKISFLSYAASLLHAENVKCIKGNILDDIVSDRCDVVLTRAVKIDSEIFKALSNTISKGGCLIIFYSGIQTPFAHQSFKTIKEIQLNQHSRVLALYQF